MKSLLLSHKRNPEEKIEKISDNKNSEEKAIEDKKEEKENKLNEGEQKNENELELDENKDNKEETKKEKKSKKRIKKSLKRNNDKNKEEKNPENENKEKEELNNNNNKQKQTNKSIGDYFSLSAKKEQNKGDNSEENKEQNNPENNNLNNQEQNTIKKEEPKDKIKELNTYINQNEIISLDNNTMNKIKYSSDYLSEIKDIPEAIKDFYSLTVDNINQDNKKQYISKLKNYFSEIHTLNNQNQTNNINPKKIN